MAVKVLRRRLLDWVSSTRGVLLVMTGVMIGMTAVTVLNYRYEDLAMRWWMVALSSMAAGAGLWALREGPTAPVRFWCGGLWALYGGTRSASWLFSGSWSGLLAWVPCLLLGLVVFARRNAAPYMRDRDEHST
jgi:hypothetical protein